MGERGLRPPLRFQIAVDPTPVLIEQLDLDLPDRSGGRHPQTRLHVLDDPGGRSTHRHALDPLPWWLDHCAPPCRCSLGLTLDDRGGRSSRSPRLDHRRSPVAPQKSAKVALPLFPNRIWMLTVLAEEILHIGGVRAKLFLDDPGDLLFVSHGWCCRPFLSSSPLRCFYLHCFCWLMDFSLAVSVFLCG